MRDCLNCGNPIVMMCQQGTHFCSMNCHDDYIEYAGRLVAGLVHA